MSNRRLKAEARAVLAGFFVLGCLAGSARAQLANSAWPMYQHDVRHTGRTSIVGPSSVFIAWTFKADGTFRSGPIVGADGAVYAGASRQLYAIEPGDGSRRWVADAIGAVKFSTPALNSSGVSYVGARDNRLHAYNADGTDKWQFSVGVDGDVSTAPVIAPDGTIYCGGTQRLHALNPNGTLQWLVQLQGVIFTGSPALAVNFAETDWTIYVTTLTGTLYAVSKTGSIDWALPVGRHVKYSAPSIGDDGTIYVGTSEGLVAVNPAGTIDWEFETAGKVSTSPAIAADGTIYVGSLGGIAGAGATLYAVNPNGTQKWAYQTNGIFRGSPIVGGNGTIYATSRANVLALNPNGTLKWQHDVGKTVFSAPAIGPDGTLYVAAGDRRLYAFAP